MATANRMTSASAQRAQMMRDAWKGVEQHGGALLAPVAAFLVAYPPLAQGIYYVLTGLWPLISISTFQLVTGHKTDLWLVQTVGVLVAVIGATLCVAGYRRQGSPEIFFLALGSALGLASVDILFVLQRQISPIYLLDAVIEIGLVALWIHGWRRGGQAQSTQPPQAIPVQQVPLGANGTVR